MDDKVPLKSQDLAFAGCILLAIVCLTPRLANFTSSTPATAASSVASITDSATPHLITKPIEEIRCGDRIPSELPEGLEPEVEPEPDPATWRLVELTVEKKDGTIVEVKLLRPLAWLQQAGAIENGHFDISVEELDIEGRAAVLDIKPCPPIQGGEGQVVTGTFRHTCDDLVELHIVGESRPIVSTSGHPIWNEHKSDFVSAADLNASDYVRPIRDESARVAQSKDVSGRAEVFNIEVSQTHVYHVGNSGILVHNVKGKCELVRFGSESEANNSKDAGGLHVSGKNTKFKNIGEPDAVDPKKLGQKNKRDFSHRITFTMQERVKHWLKANDIPESPGHGDGTYQIPAKLVNQFNEMVLDVAVEKRR